MNRWFLNSKSVFMAYEAMIENEELQEGDKLLLKTIWLKYLKYLDQLAIKDSIFFHSLQLIVIIAGVLIPVIEQSKLNYELGMSSITIISILGLTVAIATALNRHFKFEERWKHYRKSAEIIRSEGEDFFARTGNYKNADSSSEAFKDFVELITNVKRQETNTFITRVRKKDSSIS